MVSDERRWTRTGRAGVDLKTEMMSGRLTKRVVIIDHPSFPHTKYSQAQLMDSPPIPISPVTDAVAVAPAVTPVAEVATPAASSPPPPVAAPTLPPLSNCKRCRQVALPDDSIIFDQTAWHRRCFYCSTCKDRMNPHETTILELSDGQLVCGKCGIRCASCRLPISKEAILTGTDAYHEKCFKCILCKSKMEDLVYAKLNDGRLVCGNCHTVVVKGKLNLPVVLEDEEGMVGVAAAAADGGGGARASPPAATLTADAATPSKRASIMSTDSSTLYMPATSATGGGNAQSATTSAPVPDSPPAARPDDRSQFVVQTLALRRELDSAKTKLSDAEIMLDRLKDASRRAVLDFNRMSSQLADERQARFEAERQVEHLRTRLSWAQDHEVLESALVDSRRQLNKLTDEVKRLVEQKVELERQITKLRQERIQLGNAVLAASPPPSPPADKLQQPLPAAEALSTPSRQPTGMTVDTQATAVNTTTTTDGKLKRQVRPKIRPADEPLQLGHIMQRHSFLVPQKCSVCTEKIWNMKAKEYRCKACHLPCHARCVNDMPRHCDRDPNVVINVKVFGTDFDIQTSIESRMVPLVVERCIEEIEKRGMTIQGVYRKSGLKTLVHDLQGAIDRSPNAGVDVDLSAVDVHVLASLLKQYFRSLPHPVVPVELFGELVQSCMEQEEKVRRPAVVVALSKLRTVNYECLKYLCIHLNTVTANAERNLMTAKNLAVVFGPNLLRSPAEKEVAASGSQLDVAAQLAGDMGYKNTVMEYLIEQCHSLFADVDTARASGPQSPVSGASNKDALLVESASPSSSTASSPLTDATSPPLCTPTTPTSPIARRPTLRKQSPAPGTKLLSSPSVIEQQGQYTIASDSNVMDRGFDVVSLPTSAVLSQQPQPAYPSTRDDATAAAVSQ